MNVLFRFGFLQLEVSLWIGSKVTSWFFIPGNSCYIYFISTDFVSILCSGGVLELASSCFLYSFSGGTERICYVESCLTGVVLHCCPTNSLQKVQRVSHFPQNYTVVYPPFPLQLKGYTPTVEATKFCSFAAHVQFNTPTLRFFLPHMSSLLLLSSTVLCTWYVIWIQDSY
jgi:hypothetical protein